MTFEILVSKRNSTTTPQVTIRKSGIVRFNSNAMKSIKTDYIEVYYDKELGKVGFKPVKGKTEHSCKINKGSLSAKSKLSVCYDFKSNKKFNIDIDGKMLIIDLSKSV